MPEIKTPLRKIINDNGDPSYIIAPENTINDVIRFLIEQCGDDGEELRCLINDIIENRMVSTNPHINI